MNNESIQIRHSAIHIKAALNAMINYKMNPLDCPMPQAKKELEAAEKHGWTVYSPDCNFYDTRGFCKGHMVGERDSAPTQSDVIEVAIS